MIEGANLAIKCGFLKGFYEREGIVYHNWNVRNHMKGGICMSEMIFIIVYAIFGYWACGKTIYANKVRIGKASDLFVTRIILGGILGPVLIPIALFRTIFHI